MKFIKVHSTVTSRTDKPASYIAVSAIEAIHPDGAHSNIQYVAHNNGGFKCFESVERVLELIAEAT